MTFALSTLDGVLTVWEAQHGVEEANPFMRLFFAHPALFLLVKSLIVGLGLLFLWRKREAFRIVAPGVLTVFWFYTGVICFHMYGISQM